MAQQDERGGSPLASLSRRRRNRRSPLTLIFAILFSLLAAIFLGQALLYGSDLAALDGKTLTLWIGSGVLALGGAVALWSSWLRKG